MRMALHGLGYALLVLGAAPAAALAAEPATAVESAAQPAPQPTTVEGFGTSVTGSALARQRGGSETITTYTMKLTGTVSNDSADHVVTGANSIADGAFNGAIGVPMVVQNSGNNVLIQNATIISVQFKP